MTAAIMVKPKMPARLNTMGIEMKYRLCKIGEWYVYERKIGDNLPEGISRMYHLPKSQTNAHQCRPCSHGEAEQVEEYDHKDSISQLQSKAERPRHSDRDGKKVREHACPESEHANIVVFRLFTHWHWLDSPDLHTPSCKAGEDTLTFCWISVSRLVLCLPLRISLKLVLKF